MVELIAAIGGGLAVAAPVMQNLGEIARGGRRMLDFAGHVLGIFRESVPPEKEQTVLRQALAQAAAMPQAEFEKQVEEIIELKMSDILPEERKAVSEYIKLMPPRIRSTFARPEDPTGTTAPFDWVADRAEDIALILPPRPPMFKQGDTPPMAPRWELVERLAIGGFGEVWKAYNDSTDSYAAFKFCLDPVSQRRILENELEVIKLVKRELAEHKHIVKLQDAYVKGDAPWLQYEFIAGGDLTQLIATWPKEAKDVGIRAQMAVKHLRTLAHTAAHCHALKPKGVVHRDLKPGNVLVARNGDLKITDFGISDTLARQSFDEAHIATVSLMTCSTPSLIRRAHTPLYASPQQREGTHPPHPSDDVHALGVMLYQMILGDTNRPLNNDYISVLTRKQVCRPLIEIISTSIASDLEDRYADAGELAAALDKLPDQLITPPVVVNPADEAKRLYHAIDVQVADAKVKNDRAHTLLDQRKWAEAVDTLEAIFHPVLRDRDLYTRAVQHRDGKRRTNDFGMEMALVPKGTFWMGGQEGKAGDKQVSIDNDFYIGVYPVTQEEWHKVMGTTPSHFRKGGAGANRLSGISDADLKRLPVENVTWNECQQFMQKLNEKMKETGWMYRLPREAEWEYACRGAATTQEGCEWNFYFQSGMNTLSPQQANYTDSALKRTSVVGSYQPNSLGLYDMHGNVWEWCECAYDGSQRVNRGGSWSDDARFCRAAYRNALTPDCRDNDLGFRISLVPSGKAR